MSYNTRNIRHIPNNEENKKQKHLKKGIERIQLLFFSHAQDKHFWKKENEKKKGIPQRSMGAKMRKGRKYRHSHINTTREKNKTSTRCSDFRCTTYILYRYIVYNFLWMNVRGYPTSCVYTCHPLCMYLNAVLYYGRMGLL